jgi:hypothetical protein
MVRFLSLEAPGFNRGVCLQLSDEQLKSELKRRNGEAKNIQLYKKLVQGDYNVCVQNRVWRTLNEYLPDELEIKVKEFIMGYADIRLREWQQNHPTETV